MAERQIDFPRPEKHVRWITPALLVLSLLCIAGVVAILVSGITAPFIGPWG